MALELTPGHTFVLCRSYLSKAMAPIVDQREEATQYLKKHKILQLFEVRKAARAGGELWRLDDAHVQEQ